MKYIQRYAGFLALALLAQWIFYIVNIDVLEDINIFSLPRITIFLAAASFIWLGLDILQNRYSRRAQRICAFWIPEAILLTAAILFPYRWISADGLAIGILQFLFTYWVANIGVYWFVIELVRRVKKSE